MSKETEHLVILAGGQSRRMGRDKAKVQIHGKRMIDHMIDRFAHHQIPIILSATQDYGSGLQHIADNPDNPAGPVGAIFTLSDYFSQHGSQLSGFYTVPVDAPHAPIDLLERLKSPDTCTVAASENQLHPVFAYWKCSIVEAVRHSYEPDSKTPSLHWLARQCRSEIIEWDDNRGFTNINTPEDLGTENNR